MYSFPGFRARVTLKPHLEDTKGYTVRLECRQKKRFISSVIQRYKGSGIPDAQGHNFIYPRAEIWLILCTTNPEEPKKIRSRIFTSSWSFGLLNERVRKIVAYQQIQL